MVEIQGAEHMDLPLSAGDDLHFLAGQEDWLREVVNARLRGTWERIDGLLKGVRGRLGQELLSSPPRVSLAVPAVGGAIVDASVGASSRSSGTASSASSLAAVASGGVEMGEVSCLVAA